VRSIQQVDRVTTGAHFHSWNLTNLSNVVAAPLPRISLVAFRMKICADDSDPQETPATLHVGRNAQYSLPFASYGRQLKYLQLG